MASPQAITGDMKVLDILTLLPQAERITAAYGLHCTHCSASGWETLEDGCRSHGMEDAEIHALLEDLNDVVTEPTQTSITLTDAAARTIHQIAEAEGRQGQILTVLPDGRGGFCLEFLTEQPEPGAPLFACPQVPQVQVTASPLVLARVGGSTIDFRDGALKFDLPEDSTEKQCCGGTGEGCKCGH